MDLHDLYPELVLEEVKNPQNRGKLSNADVSASEGVASCGDTATVYVQVKSGKIQQMTWEAEGCAISRAGLSLLSVAVENQPIKRVEGWTIKEMLSLLHLKQISPGREQCMMLGLRALQRALTQLSISK
ncbi:iron-sulfur cluster assembly scaffold protein [Candidatus Woesebacteria bacterium]|nr:iron-sulfur cluster assembly scaffold protein [Candidatus Woesebacteria bacterium]